MALSSHRVKTGAGCSVDRGVDLSYNGGGSVLPALSEVEGPKGVAEGSVL